MTRLRAKLAAVPRRELLLVGAAMALGLAIRITYVLLSRDQPLAGDQLQYDMQGRYFAEGRFFWSDSPWGVPHPTMWKTPVYPAFIGVLYKVLGADPHRVLLVQTLFGPVTIALTWALARRLFTPVVGVVAAFVVAIYPFAWQYEARLFAEGIVAPLTLVFLLLVLRREAPTVRSAAVVGFVVGITLLVRPSSVYELPVVLAAYLVASGLRRGALMTAVTVGTAALCVLPWTVRNYVVSGAFVPLSVQEAALYGTFNDEAAHDPKLPYAWRQAPAGVASAFELPAVAPGDVRALTEAEATLARRLRALGTSYIEEHPTAVLGAFWHNGVRRTWDLRPPSEALLEVRFQGRSRTLTGIGLGMYWPLLALAVYSVVRLRSVRWLAVPVTVLALSTSLVFTTIAGTRYRAPIEPLIVVLACAAPMAAVRARELSAPS